MSPIAALPWPLAHVLWAMLLGVIPLPMIGALASFARLPDRTSTYLFAGLVLALAPLHTGIGVGNVSIPAIALCAIAVWAAGVQKDLIAGLLLGAATCLKPQLGIWFILYYVARKRWPVILVAASMGTTVLLVGILRLEMSGATWLSDFLHNARGFAVENPTVDFTEHDPIRFTLINLQVLMYSIVGSAGIARVFALLSGASLLGVWYWLGFKTGKRPPELLTLSTLLVLSLLPAYHRNYDATALIFPLCWVVSRIEGGLRKGDGVILLLMLPFAIPGGALLQQLVDAGRIPTLLVDGWWWNTLIMPHEIWCLLCLSVVLFCAMAASPSQPGVPRH